MSLSYRHRARSALIVLACLGFGAGCGSQTPASSSAPAELGEAGPNQRLRFKPEYKQMIGKHGELLKKRPANIPKG
ncbi:MAG: hypothetical protein P4L85_22595 [Paludisphaera borealis]|uniref:hypothetical protein n=1 Tax=Paludisphaera borealis TaxID=1387353 RepID=UPI00283EBE92|nr:hypothetical protein [Paludisphaera borealis]MDR3622157.1 hypothetical protein [Paludisphaera borealis]